MLTVREIAAILKVVPAMIGRGQLAHFRANKSIRVRRSALERLLREA